MISTRESLTGFLSLALLSCVGLHAQNIDVSPKLIRFADQGIQSAGSALSVTLWNNQTSTLKIYSIQATAPFAVSSNCGASLAPNAKCTINISFRPTTVKYYTGTVTMTDSAGNSPQVINVDGNGVLAIKYTPAVGGFYFNHQIVNTPSTPQAVTLTNQQAGPISFSGMSSAPEFPFTTNCGDGHGGGSLAGGASCTVLVTFDPPAVTTYSASLTIHESASGSPIVIPLTGSGISGTPAPMIVVTPPTPCVVPSEQEQMNLEFISTSASAVNWYVDGIHNGNANTGAISAGGLYTAPSVQGTHVIRAVSQSNTKLGGNSNVTVTTAPGFELYPYVASIPTGGQQQFAAQTCQSTDNHAVTYAVDGIVGGNGTVGTITRDGLYTAPNAPGAHKIQLTDTVINKTTVGQVTVFSSITADFGLRARNTAAIPANMFGYGRAESLRTASDRSLLTSAGVTEARLSAQILLVFATSAPNWSQIDPLIRTIQASGQHALLQLNQSPPWLQPTSGTCAGNSYAAPTDNNAWAQMAAQYVAHMDATFPGVVTDYEIWNEPNATGMCAANHLTSYMALYAAAAPAMKAQAAQDGKTIRVGGPVTSGFNPSWLTPFLTDPTTAPHVDFVSYHHYLFGTTGLDAQWDTYTGHMSVYEAEQDPNVGASGEYRRTQAVVAAGKQPGGAATPIYVSEYNTNWAFFQDCCRNNPTYAPVFNALYLVDMLDTVYNGASQMPARLFYFAGSAYPYFCLIGVKDSNNDCLYSVGAVPVAYPQYYAFDLLASPSYLGLSAGGYMAKSLSTPTGGGGLATAAFYTSSQDALVIINPTSTSYPQISVALANTGFSSTQGTLYAIVNGDQITASNISFAVHGSTLTTTIDVPPYSVRAISLK